MSEFIHDFGFKRSRTAEGREVWKLLQGERDLSSRLAILCTLVSRSHPLGWPAIHARFDAERRDAGNRADQLEAMLDRWLVLAEEASAEEERQRQEHARRNGEIHRERAVQAMRQQWQEKTTAPLLASIAHLRTELDELVKATGAMADDAGLLTVIDRFSEAFKVADKALLHERKEARLRIADARAKASVECFAPTTEVAAESSAA